GTELPCVDSLSCGLCWPGSAPWLADLTNRGHGNKLSVTTRSSKSAGTSRPARSAGWGGPLGIGGAAGADLRRSHRPAMPSSVFFRQRISLRIRPVGQPGLRAGLASQSYAAFCAHGGAALEGDALVAGVVAVAAPVAGAFPWPPGAALSAWLTLRAP